ncbi:hypothetical protein SHKM778_89300 [Streptomyces sp. KM77-8]|uniref:Uncharacterized protein n=1 Tax=Streptomyces haneummycinicus TaxID=3074435 RepID=A0AAT9HZM4_9ACTN
MTVETVRTVPRRAPVTRTASRTRDFGGWWAMCPKPSSVTGRKPSAVSAPRSAAAIVPETTSEPTGASGRKPRRYRRRRRDRKGAAERGGGQRGGRGGGGRGGADAGGQQIAPAARADQVHPGQAHPLGVPGERLGHRVPLDGDRGGHENACR